MARSDAEIDADRELAKVTRENAYLKLRNAQLQEDVTALGAELDRLRQELERRGGLRAPAD
ncbi:MAG TPA: hypothetical protein VGI95_21030 [Caulobacteraceae bacterium]|jgi:hypothetical protein